MSLSHLPVSLFLVPPFFSICQPFPWNPMFSYVRQSWHDADRVFCVLTNLTSSVTSSQPHCLCHAPLHAKQPGPLQTILLQDCKLVEWPLSNLCPFLFFRPVARLSLKAKLGVLSRIPGIPPFDLPGLFSFWLSCVVIRARELRQYLQDTVACCPAWQDAPKTGLEYRVVMCIVA